MGENLLYHHLFVNEAYNLHLAGALKAGKRPKGDSAPVGQPPRFSLYALKEMLLGCIPATSVVEFVWAYTSLTSIIFNSSTDGISRPKLSDACLFRSPRIRFEYQL